MVRRVMNIVGSILCSIAKSLGVCISSEPEPLPSDYPVYETTWSAVNKELSDLGLKAMENPEDIPDIHFYYTDEKNWATLISHLTYTGEIYAQFERRDCDDYSKKASADSSFLFGLNTIQVWGNTPFGYHAFDGVKTENGWKIFEPNAGFPVAGELLNFENEYGWEPKKYKP